MTLALAVVGSRVEEWGWVGFRRLSFEILASRGDGRGAMIGCWVFLVSWCIVVGWRGDLGGEGGLRKVWCCCRWVGVDLGSA